MEKIVEALAVTMPKPGLYGLFHVVSLLLTAVIIVFVCIGAKKADARKVTNIVFWTAVVVVLMELYKQFVYTHRFVDGVLVIDYQWYAFPWQFCSTPMYVGLLAGIIRKGKVHDSLCAYLITI